MGAFQRFVNNAVSQKQFKARCCRGCSTNSCVTNLLTRLGHPIVNIPPTGKASVSANYLTLFLFPLPPKSLNAPMPQKLDLGSRNLNRLLPQNNITM